MMGGQAAVQNAAEKANATGGPASWRWSLESTSLLLDLDPADAEAWSRVLRQHARSASALGLLTRAAST